MSEAKKRWVVAIDGSDQALRALDVALELARPPDIVYLVHAIPPLQKDSPSFFAHDKIRKASADSVVNPAVAKIKDSGLQHFVRIREGDPAMVILAESEAGDGSYIVLGSRGRTGIKKMFLGSVSSIVVGQSSRPVIVVK